MAFNILVTQPIPENGLRLLREAGEVELLSDDGPPPAEQLQLAISGRDGLLCLLTDPVTADVIERADQLKGIANYAVGYDNIDVEAATNHGIRVTNTPGVLTDATADLAWALILAVARHVVPADRFVREGRFHGWRSKLYLGVSIAGRRLAIVGPGRIGTAVARRGRGFDMDLVYVGRSPSPDIEALGARRVDLEEACRTADVLSLHTPLTDETHHLIGAPELRAMKKDALLINTARGPVVDERALLLALEENEIGGAGLDVYEREPDVTRGLLGLSNVVLLPHLGSATKETRETMAEMAAKNLIACMKDQEPQNPVN